ADGDDLGHIADEETDEIGDVNADIHHRAAAGESPFVHPAGPELGESDMAAERAEMIDRADRAAVDHLLQQLHARIVPVIETDGQPDALLACALHEAET